MNYLQVLAEKIGYFDFEKFPPELIKIVKRSIIDTIGVMILGSSDKAIEKIEDIYKNYKSAATNTVLGKNYKMPLEIAVLINGTSAHMLDYDDTGAATQGHPSAPILPALLGLAESNNYSGKKIIEAFVVGVEVFSLLSRYVPMLHLKGWHPTATLGTIASAAASSRILNLSCEQVMNAIGIAASFSGGLIINFGTMTKPLQVGKASSNGMLAALLASKGFTASGNILNDKNNYLSILNGNSDYKLDDNLKLFGEELAILKYGINIKRYPSCSLSHRAIDVMIDLAVKNPIKTDDIISIQCRITPRTYNVLFYNNPKEPLEAKFSMPFLLACALKYKKVSPVLFNQDIINNSDLQNIMSKVDFKIHEDWQEERDTWRPDIIRIIMKNNLILSGEAVYPKGHSKNPMLNSELEAKYFQCCKDVLNEESMEKSYKLLNHLEESDTINDLLNILTV